MIFIYERVKELTVEQVSKRFHVMKLVNKSLNKIRLSLDLKGLKSGCVREATTVRSRPVGFLRVARAPSNRSLLLKNTCDLTKEEEVDLRKLLNQSPCLNIAYELKEELRNIYETSSTIKMGLRKIKKAVRGDGAGLFHYQNNES